jgi:Cu(I)/Ag(I) efflux system membrane fusion protein
VNDNRTIHWLKSTVLAGLLVCLLVGAVGAGYALHWGLTRFGHMHPQASPADTHSEHSEHSGGMTQEEVQLWTCSMHPQIRQPKPGKCPICRMDLVPVKSSGGGLRQISISPETQKLMNIRTTPVQQRYVTAEVRMVGKVTYDETRLGYITAWVAGRLDRLYVDYTGVPVQKGHHMVSMYSPELYITSDELIQALKFAKQEGPLAQVEKTRVEAAREKLRLYGMTPDQIKEVEQREKPSDHMTIYAPMGGIVIEKLKQQGDYVKTGDRIYTVADLSQVWVMLDAYESDLPWIRYGQEVTFTTEAYPGEKFRGQIAFIDPVLDDKTRTVKVRVNVPNADGKLKPDMFVHGVVRSQVAGGGRVIDPGLAGKWISPMHPEIVKDKPGTCDICGMPLVRAETLGYVPADEIKGGEPLVIPVSAALVTGTRAIVYVQVPGQKEPTYEGREIVLGPQAGNYYLVRNGLKEGDLVVTHGNFKIDSALQIQAKPSMMTPEGGGGGGHHHGDEGPRQKETGEPGMTIPHAFHEQLLALDSAQDRVASALKEENLEKIRTAFVAFGESLAKVDGKLLKGHPAMLWQELSMLLENDGVEGRDVKKLSEAKRIYELLKRHMERVHEQLGKGHEGGSPVDLTVPREFQVQLGKVWERYLSLQQALATDNLPAGRKAVAEVRGVLEKVDAKGLSERAQAFWQREHTNLDRIADQLGQARSLEKLREGFSPLSDELTLLVKTFAIEPGGPVYELRCSMAFGGRGASWLQKDDEPRNPYFGAEMPACADQVRQIAGQNVKDAKEEAKEGHDHE